MKLSREQKAALGQITTFPAHWVFGKHGQFTREQDGRTITLISKRGLVCKNPQWQDDKPMNQQNNGWWVAQSDCRKCPFYEKGGVNFKFPRCLWKVRANTPREAASVVMTARAEAFGRAMRIMFGAPEDTGNE